ncbi:MAG: phosphoglycerate kinase [Syntrophomonadaceae bacterium]|nr:phosphoglycerate kinase [Syntrophomonadaceae bacterium]
MQTIKDVQLQGKTVLLRVDFNIPMNKDGTIIDDSKMKAALPTLEYILNQGARVIVMSHLGRPKGRPDSQYSMKPLAGHLQSLVKNRVIMATDSIGPAVQEAVSKLQPGEILLLENLRFYKEEEQNDPNHAQQLADLADIFVNDAFGAAHRAHASTVGVADYLPAYAGLLMEQEVKMLRQVLDHPESPRMAILGGAKVADKLGLIGNLINKMDILLIAGGMGNTFIKAQGHSIGKSMHEADRLEEAAQLLQTARERDVKILLPIDVVAADAISADAAWGICPVDSIPADKMIVDIGPQTIEIFCAAIRTARTIIWNGPLGVYEYEQFARGTWEAARAIAESPAVSVIGGGDSAAAVQNLGLEKDITHISTGGGATLEFLEGRTLPGVAVAERAEVLP